MTCVKSRKSCSNSPHLVDISAGCSDKNRDQRLESIRQRSHIDATFGYRRVTDSVPRIAWLVNVQSVGTAAAYLNSKQHSGG